MILALVLTGLMFTPTGGLNSDMIQRMMVFDGHYYAFKAALLGCPKGAQLVSECRLPDGTINYKEFLACAKEARKLFLLDDPK